MDETESDAALLKELCDMQTGEGTYCCACCYTWYRTREEKWECMKGHGYEVLEIGVAGE